VLEFCTIPLTLASATLDALARDGTKLSRDTVRQLAGPPFPRQGL